MTLLERGEDIDDILDASLLEAGLKPDEEEGADGERYVVWRDPARIGTVDVQESAASGAEPASPAELPAPTREQAAADLGHFVMNEPGYIKL